MKQSIERSWRKIPTKIERGDDAPLPPCYFQANFHIHLSLSQSIVSLPLFYLTWFDRSANSLLLPLVSPPTYLLLFYPFPLFLLSASCPASFLSGGGPFDHLRLPVWWTASFAAARDAPNVSLKFSFEENISPTSSFAVLSYVFSRLWSLPPCHTINGAFVWRKGHLSIYIMAEVNIASVTGAQPAPDLRRRNVPGAEKPSVVHNDMVDNDHKKTRPTVWTYPVSSFASEESCLTTYAIQSNSYLSVLRSWEPIITPIILTALSIFTRMYRIGRSNIVTWDEAQ